MKKYVINLIKIFLAIFIVFFCYAQKSFAAPTISDVSGTLSSDQNIVITGSSFGGHDSFGSENGLMYAWNNFENGQTDNDGYHANPDLYYSYPNSCNPNCPIPWNVVSGSTNKTNSSYYAQRVDL